MLRPVSAGLLAAPVAAVLCLACFRQAHLTPEKVDAIPIVELERFPAEHREAIRAADRELRSQKEDPRDFFARIGESDDGFLTVVHLLHADAFLPEYAGVAGNPGGKCRDMYYDRRTGSIARTYVWQ